MAELKKTGVQNYVRSRRKLSGLFFETALPNEYLLEVGRRQVEPQLGGRRWRFGKKFIRVPASIQTLYFATDNANMDYQGIGIEGYATWRIDPSHPDVAFQALDFFDDEDPMARTNRELTTICVEAVRHVISNMGIDDALKKKDEIAGNLKAQLQEVEHKWGILFDKVGIEKVRIMSASLFENLQAQFRDGLRLEVEKKRIATDRDIAREKNATRESTDLETLETDRKIGKAKVENESHLAAASLQEKNLVAQKQREIDEANFREGARFRLEKGQKEHEIILQEKERERLRLMAEHELLKKQSEVERLRIAIATEAQELERLKRQVSQIHSPEALSEKLVGSLPEIFKAMKIEHYNVWSGDGAGMSPIPKVIAELAASLKATDLAGIFKGGPKTDGTKAP